MRIKLLIGLLALLVASTARAARGPERVLATPVFEDQSNQTEIFAVSPGTYNSIKLYTPRQPTRGTPIEERKVFIENLSATRNLLITTWAVPATEFMSSTNAATVPSFVLRMTTSSALFAMELPAGNTFYARYERGVGGAINDPLTGASSDTVRGMVHSVNQSLINK